jgi:23S rRNA (cytosine1962-C5)-methyltransferase
LNRNHSQQYELLDFGGGRKLERFGAVVVDRAAVAAMQATRPDSSLWDQAMAQFELSDAKSNSARGKWIVREELPSPWICESGDLRFELKLTDFGHVGLFPEQQPNWKWIREQVQTCAARGDQGSQEIEVLNLFAHTGGSTLAAAAAGSHVAHVDSAANVVAWARRNAIHSNLEDAPIRWLAEDALKFARRELKRGKRYHGLILDPPGYGHGPAGEVWRIEEQLPDLLSICRQLLAEDSRFVLLSCHAPDYDGNRLAELLAEAGITGNADTECGDLFLSTADGRRLSAGTFARVSAV